MLEIWWTSYLGLVHFSNTKLFLKIISQFITNTFTLTSPSLTPLGITVSPLVALINHSCDPNAVVVFPRGHGGDPSHEPVMHIIALREISEGDEVGIFHALLLAVY